MTWWIRWEKNSINKTPKLLLCNPFSNTGTTTETDVFTIHHIFHTHLWKSCLQNMVHLRILSKKYYDQELRFQMHYAAHGIIHPLYQEFIIEISCRTNRMYQIVPCTFGFFYVKARESDADIRGKDKQIHPTVLVSALDTCCWHSNLDMWGGLIASKHFLFMYCAITKVTLQFTNTFV